MGETLTNANPSETDKIKTHYARIVVDGTAEKPYYSIEWYDQTKNEYVLGYSSYHIGYVFKWLEECFEIVEAPKTNADHIRAMSDEELASWFCNSVTMECCYNTCPARHICSGDDNGMLKWLKQPFEGE